MEDRNEHAAADAADAGGPAEAGLVADAGRGRGGARLRFTSAVDGHGPGDGRSAVAAEAEAEAEAGETLTRPAGNVGRLLADLRVGVTAAAFVDAACRNDPWVREAVNALHADTRMQLNDAAMEAAKKSPLKYVFTLHDGPVSTPDLTPAVAAMLTLAVCTSPHRYQLALKLATSVNLGIDFRPPTEAGAEQGLYLVHGWMPAIYLTTETDRWSKDPTFAVFHRGDGWCVIIPAITDTMGHACTGLQRLLLSIQPAATQTTLVDAPRDVADWLESHGYATMVQTVAVLNPASLAEDALAKLVCGELSDLPPVSAGLDAIAPAPDTAATENHGHDAADHK